MIVTSFAACQFCAWEENGKNPGEKHVKGNKHKTQFNIQKNKTNSNPSRIFLIVLATLARSKRADTDFAVGSMDSIYPAPPSSSIDKWKQSLLFCVLHLPLSLIIAFFAQNIKISSQLWIWPLFVVQSRTLVWCRSARLSRLVLVLDCIGFCLKTN